MPVPNRFWMAVASREHVLRGIGGGFCQVCHGKGAPLKLMEPGDWIVYYSPKEVFEESIPCRKLTAIGKISSKDPYLFRMSDDFVPWRRDVSFYPAKETPIEPLIEQLSFIKDKRHWGSPFRRGFFSLPKDDFILIATQMELQCDDPI